MNTILSTKMPVGTDMKDLRNKLKKVKSNRKDGKSANALIAAYIFKITK